MKWISVKDRLPKYDEWVLVFADSRISIGKYVNSHGRLFWSSQSSEDSCCSCSQTDFKEVTLWMPLPEEPNKSQYESKCRYCGALDNETI